MIVTTTVARHTFSRCWQTREALQMEATRKHVLTLEIRYLNELCSIGMKTRIDSVHVERSNQGYTYEHAA